jgi:hypothetical protein
MNKSCRRDTLTTPSRNPDHAATARSRYMVSIEWERVYGNRRYHWTVCAARKPDELVSWGHAPTRVLAVTAAEDAVSKLMSG